MNLVISAKGLCNLIGFLVFLVLIMSLDCRLYCWSAIAKFLDTDHSTPSFFTGLCLLRLMLYIGADQIEESTEISQIQQNVYNQILGICDNIPTFPKAQTILLLSVLLNYTVAASTKKSIHDSVLRVLPFVFSSMSACTDVDITTVAAGVIFNLCLSNKSDDEILHLTLVGGCVELLERYALGESYRDQEETCMNLTAAVGLLILNFNCARALAIELGLVQVLTRLKQKTAWKKTCVLATEVMAMV